MLINEPHHGVGEAIGDFYRDRRHDDLTLLYFTGHGLKDDEGRLYLAMTNTRRDGLLFTALSAEQVDQAMEGCASRQRCWSSTAATAARSRPAARRRPTTAVHTLERFQGRGRTVLTASDATQYSFEGDDLRGAGDVSRCSPATWWRRSATAAPTWTATATSPSTSCTATSRPGRRRDAAAAAEETGQRRGPHRHRPKRQLDAAGLPPQRHREPDRRRAASAVQELGHLHRAGNDVVRTAVDALPGHAGGGRQPVGVLAATALLGTSSSAGRAGGACPRR